MKLILMVAMDKEGTIGRDGTLPWHLRSDLQRFKRLTMGHVLVMGRTTYESIGRPLPGRTTVVLSRSPEKEIEGVRVVGGVAETLQVLGDMPQVFVVGGGTIYAEFLPFADEIWVTWVEAIVAGDTRFPNWKPQEWLEIESEAFPAGAQDDFPTRFVRYVRR